MPTLYENNEINDAQSWSCGATDWRSQTFTPSLNHTCDWVAIKAFKSGTPTTATLSIRAVDGNGKPTGNDLCSGTFDPTILPQGSGYINPRAVWVKVSMGVGAALVASTQYAIVIRVPGGGLYTNNITLIRSGNTYASGQLVTSADSGSTWTLYGAQDFLFAEWAGEPIPPSVTTQAVTAISGTTATGNGNATSLGSENIINHGHVWSTSTNPTLEETDNGVENGTKSETGAFTSFLTGLSPDTVYYVKSYAMNSGGIVYGNEVEFITFIPKIFYF